MRHVICLGSWQGSDAAAWALADRLDVYAQECTELQIHRALSPSQMLDLFGDATSVLLIDATPDLPAGQLALISREDIRQTRTCSSHGLDLLAALDLIEALGDLPSLQILALGVGDSKILPVSVAEQALPEVLALLRRV